MIINKEQALKNKKFDEKLKKMGLIDFIRRSDFINNKTEITITHLRCNRTFKVTPRNFFKRQNKCKHCGNIGRPKSIITDDRKAKYQNKIDMMTNKEFELLSDYQNKSSEIKLKHLVCGHIFETRADNFENAKEKCPKCAGRINYNSLTLKDKIYEIESILNFEYELITKLFTDKDRITLKHKACGTEFEKSVSTIKKMKNKKLKEILCPECNCEDRKEEFLDRLNRKHKNKFSLHGKYVSLNTKTSFKHNRCGRFFKDTPSHVLKKISDTCPNCSDNSRKYDFQKRLDEFYNEEYELIGDYTGIDTKLKIKHKNCGRIEEVYGTNLFKNSHICKECSKKYRLNKKRDEFIKKIELMYGGKFTLIGEYNGTKIDTEFKCNDCGEIFITKPDRLIHKNKSCPGCKNKDKKEVA